MKRRIQRKLAKQKRRISARLERARRLTDSGAPVLPRTGVHYEMSERVRAISHGGIGAVHRVVTRLGLAKAIDDRLEVLKLHRPYHESDHVLNIAYNLLCGGQTLDDIELRRNDEVYLDALGVEAIPDPTTAGDFCRRFDASDVESLMEAINEVRLTVWSKQGEDFIDTTARIDVDGTMVPTTGECKEGMALSYKNEWGYLPLLVSFANTSEPLFIVNRGGNRPSHEGANGYLDKAAALCRRAGFTDMLFRGDTDFSQTKFLDEWDKDGIRFVFGYDAMRNIKELANDLDAGAFYELERRAKRAFVEEDDRRARPTRFKEEFVRAKGYKNIRLRSEDVAEFDYRPRACTKTYRMVVVRKNLTVMRGGNELFDDIRYFFYITNDRDLTVEQVVFEANDRCNQENLVGQMKSGGARALHAPVNTLNANWAYMVMASLAWTMKAWMALSLPISPRWKAKHHAERLLWLRMEFRTFCNAVINIPAQIIRSGRRRIFRLLAWRPQLPWRRIGSWCTAPTAARDRSGSPCTRSSLLGRG